MEYFVAQQPIALTVIFSFLLPSETVRCQSDLYNFMVSSSTIQKSFMTNDSFWIWHFKHEFNCRLCTGESQKLNSSIVPIAGHCFWREECRSHFANRRLRRQWWAKVSNRILLLQEDIVGDNMDNSPMLDTNEVVNAKSQAIVQSVSPSPTLGIMSAAILKIVNYFFPKQKNQISPIQIPGTLSKKVMLIKESSMVKLLDRFLTLEIKVLLEGKRDLKHCHVGISQLFRTEVLTREREVLMTGFKDQTSLDQLILMAIKQSDWKRVTIKKKLKRRKSWTWSKYDRRQQGGIKEFHQIVEDMRESVGGEINIVHSRVSEERLSGDLEDNIFWYKMQLSPLESLHHAISSGLLFRNPSMVSLISDESRALLVAVKLLPCANSINSHSFHGHPKDARGDNISMAARLAGVVVIPLTNGKKSFFEDFESDNGSDDNITQCPSWTDLITIEHPLEYHL